MTRYVAFLRGINVSGKKLIKMDNLRRIFTSLKLKNVKTFIQSGNVLFEDSEKKADALLLKIEKGLTKSLGYEVTVFLRTLPEMEAIVKSNPFKKLKSGARENRYVTFLSNIPDRKLKLPFLPPKKDVKLLRIEGRDVFSLSLEGKDGRFGFPNAIVEKELGMPATTRNWSTVNKIILTPS